MDEAAIDDLKQFILATVTQATAHLARKEELQTLRDNMATKTDLSSGLIALEKRLNKRFDDLELKVDTIADAHAVMLEDHELAIQYLQAHLL